MIETWRVVLESGETRQIFVEQVLAEFRAGDGAHPVRQCARTPRAAIIAHLTAWGAEAPPIVEILAPGEQSRDEIRGSR